MPEIKIEIGQRMLLLRKKLKVNQAEVAAFLGVSVAAYQNYETGRREANYEMLSKLADFYGVTTDYLLGRSEAPPDPIPQLTDDEMEKAVMEEYFQLPKPVRAQILEMMINAVQRSEQRKRQNAIKHEPMVARDAPGAELPDVKLDAQQLDDKLPTDW